MRTATRLIGGTAVVALALAACGGSGDGSDGDGDAITFLGPVPPSVFMFPGFVAEELGFWEEEGIDYSYETIGESVAMTTLLVNGNTDVAGPGATEVFQGLNSGQEFVLIYNQTPAAAEGIAVLADSPIQSLADLEGTTVGLVGDEVRSLLAIALDTVGLAPDDVDQAIIGESTATILNSLESGTIDAFVGSVLDFAGLESAGIELRDITPDEVGHIPATTFAVTPDRLEDDRDVLERFLRGWSRALHVGLTNPDVVEAIMRDVAPEEWQDEEVGRSMLEVAIDLQMQGPDNYGDLGPENWEEAMEQALVAGDISEEIPLDTFLDESLLDAANDFDREETEQLATDWLAENG